MTLRDKLGVAAEIALAATLSIVAWSWLGEHDARLRAEAAASGDRKTIADTQAAIAARDAQLDRYQQEIARQIAQVKSAPDAVRVIEHYLPAPAAAPVVIEKSGFAPAEQAKLPDAPSYVVQTQQQAVETAQTLLQCDADRQALKTCHADLLDTKAEAGASAAEAKTWEQAAKGGSKWHRMVSAAKWLGIGAAAGAAGYAAWRR